MINQHHFSVFSSDYSILSTIGNEATFLNRYLTSVNYLQFFGYFKHRMTNKSKCYSKIILKKYERDIHQEI
jgi:hypothetical protein